MNLTKLGTSLVLISAFASATAGASCRTKMVGTDVLANLAIGNGLLHMATGGKSWSEKLVDKGIGKSAMIPGISEAEVEKLQGELSNHNRLTAGAQAVAIEVVKWKFQNFKDLIIGSKFLVNHPGRQHAFPTFHKTNAGIKELNALAPKVEEELGKKGVHAETVTNGELAEAVWEINVESKNCSLTALSEKRLVGLIVAKLSKTEDKIESDDLDADKLITGGEEDKKDDLKSPDSDDE